MHGNSFSSKFLFFPGWKAELGKLKDVNLVEFCISMWHSIMFHYLPAYTPHTRRTETNGRAVHGPLNQNGSSAHAMHSSEIVLHTVIANCGFIWGGASTFIRVRRGCDGGNCCPFCSLYGCKSNDKVRNKVREHNLI